LGTRAGYPKRKLHQLPFSVFGEGGRRPDEASSPAFHIAAKAVANVYAACGPTASIPGAAGAGIVLLKLEG